MADGMLGGVHIDLTCLGPDELGDLLDECTTRSEAATSDLHRAYWSAWADEVRLVLAAIAAVG